MTKVRWNTAESGSWRNRSSSPTPPKHLTEGLLFRSLNLTVPRWIPIVLYLAAFYNLVWGAFVVFFPLVPFRLAGMEPPNYPALVQCLGMIVGVYGIGYALAARDPVTLWPLVLVGLLGKIFGPIGFVYAAAIGEFPWHAGFNILTNDLVWWLPFTAILLQAARIQDARLAGADGQSLADVLRGISTQQGESVLELSQRQDLLLVCVRHSGCTYCREALDDLAQQKQTIEQQGMKPIVVHMSDSIQGAELLKRYGCEGIDHVSDPQRRVYRALELHLGTLSELFGIQAFRRALIGGTIFRYGFGRIVGSVLQMPGTFVIRDGQIVKAFRHRSSSERGNYSDLVCEVR